MTRQLTRTFHGTVLMIALVVFVGCSSAGTDGGDSGGDSDLPLYENYITLLADDGVASDDFGSGLAMTSEFILVGASDDGDNGIESGSVYAFEPDQSGEWTQVQKFSAPDGEAGEYFGSRIILAGDQVLINGEESDINSIHVFEQDGSGDWVEVQEIPAPTGIGSFESFGFDIAVDGAFALFGAYDDDTDANDSGSVYVFERDGSGVWTESQKISNPNPEAFSYFGGSIALSGDWALVGATQDPDGASTGVVYAYERGSGGTWSLSQTIVAPDQEDYDGFGAVAIEGDTALIGKSGDSTLGSSAGRVYVYVRDGTGTWQNTDDFAAADTEATDYFGSDIAMKDGTAIVYSSGAGDFALGLSSAVYVFEEQTDGTWSEVAKINQPYDPTGFNRFASDWSIGDGVIAIGATDASNDSDVETGAAFVFTR